MKTIIIMLLAVGILSCIPEGEQPEQTKQPEQTEQPGQTKQDKEWEQLRATFEAEKAAWKALGIHSYRFTAQTHLPPVPHTIPFTVTVLPDTEPEVTPVIRYEWEQQIWEREYMSIESREKPFSPYYWVTIDDFYDTLHLSKPGESIYSISEGIRYNQKYHYPERYSFYIRSSDDPGGQYSDSFEITQFEVLGGQEEQEKELKLKEWKQYLATCEAEKAAWKAQGIHSYRFTAKSTYHIIPDTIPFTVTVLPDTEPEVTPVIGSIQDQEIWERVMKMEIRKTVPFFPFVWVTIDDYYDNIQWTELSINSVIIQYNQEYHYPERHIFTYDSSRFEITQFEVLGE